MTKVDNSQKILSIGVNFSLVFAELFKLNHTQINDMNVP